MCPRSSDHVRPWFCREQLGSPRIQCDARNDSCSHVLSSRWVSFRAQLCRHWGGTPRGAALSPGNIRRRCLGVWQRWRRRPRLCALEWVGVGEL